MIVPGLTWPATSNMVIACGARPVFADIDPVTWNLDPAAVAAGAHAAHADGRPGPLRRPARRPRRASARCSGKAGREDVTILEDAAHAAGASYKGRPIGACTANGSAAACFSFHPIKNMTTGEGGMVTTDDDELAARIKLWKFHGVQRDAWKAYSAAEKAPATYDVVLPGLQVQPDRHPVGARRPPAPQAAALQRPPRRDRRLLRPRAGRRSTGSSCPGAAPYEHVHPWHLFTVLAPNRAEFMDGLRAREHRHRPPLRGGPSPQLLPRALRVSRGDAARSPKRSARASSRCRSSRR